MILVLIEQGTLVSIKAGKVIISNKKLKRTLPKELIESVTVFGNISLTTPFVQHCLSRKIPVAYFTRNGKYLGRTYALEGYNVNRVKKQLAWASDLDYCLTLAKTILEAKANNQIVILRRIHRKKSILKREISNLEIIKRKIPSCKKLEELLGIEGNIARTYYQAVSKSLKKDFQFSKRSKRPPKDPFNAMISLGYSILLNEILGHIESSGLISYAGFIHGHSRNYPSLASDLIEEYRAIIIDSLVISLINQRKVTIDDFETNDNGVYLKKIALKKYVYELQNKLVSKHQYLDYISKPITYREAIHHQCKRLAIAIEDGNPEYYEPVRIR